MRVGVPHWLMRVPVRMRFCHIAAVSVLVMFIVNVGVLVFQRLVDVLMLMTFREMKPDPDCHQQPSSD